MQVVEIDCDGVATTDEFWQRYLDGTQPSGAALFGRNLDAFQDALAGGPGWPGNVQLVFLHSDALGELRLGSGGLFLAALREIASSETGVEIRLD